MSNNDKHQLEYSLDDLRRLATTEPNIQRRAQYAEMLKKAQGYTRKADGDAQAIKAIINQVLGNYHSQTGTGERQANWMKVTDGPDDDSAYKYTINVNNIGSGLGGALRSPQDGWFMTELKDALEAYGEISVRSDGVTMYISVPKPGAGRGKAWGAEMRKGENFIQPGKLKPNDVAVAFHTDEADSGEKDGVKYWTAIVQGMPICPSWTDEERVRQVAESFHHGKEGKGGGIYLWDGDKGKYLPYDRQIDTQEATRPQINSAPYRR